MRLRVVVFVKARKVSVVDGEERRGPRLQPVRAAARFVDSPEHVENVGGFASLEQPVLLVEGKRDPSLTQVFRDFDAVAVGTGQDINVSRR